MNVEELRLFVNYLANKDQTGNSLSPAEYNILLPRACDDFFNRMYGLYQEYQIDMPSPRVAWEVTQYVTDALAPFKVYVPAQAVNGSGQITKPAGYYHHSSLRYTYNKPPKCAGDPTTPIVKGIKIIKDSEISGITSDYNKKPREGKLYACYYNTYIQLFPVGLTTVEYTYLTKPPAPVWGFTVVNGVAVYASGTSTQIPFPDFTHNDIAIIILSYMGINLREQLLMQYSELKKKTG